MGSCCTKSATATLPTDPSNTSTETESKLDRESTISSIKITITENGSLTHKEINQQIAEAAEHDLKSEREKNKVNQSTSDNEIVSEENEVDKGNETKRKETKTIQKQPQETSPKLPSANATQKSQRTSVTQKNKPDKVEIRNFIDYLEDPDGYPNFDFPEFSRSEIQRKSQQSTKTGKSMIFPNHKDEVVLTHTPPQEGTFVSIETTFWSGKKKLIPDYKVMEKIDQHVLKVDNSLRKDADKLVQYLIKPCKTDVEKARAFIRWIGENIAYDTNFLETGERGGQSVEEVLRTGRAVCDGYGTTFSHLGSLAGLECKKISGQAKGAGYYPGCFDPEHLSDGPGAHAWNAVKLGGQWYLSDPTWAAGAVSSKGGKKIFNKNWSEQWFLSEPTYFVLSHMPLDGNNIQTDEQQLEKPISDPKLWAELALISPQAGIYGIKPLTHHKALIETSSGEVIIQYACSFPLRQWIDVTRIEKRGNVVNKVTGPDINKTVALFTLEGRSTILTRFLEKGTYDLEIVCNIKNGHSALEVAKTILHYRVSNTGKGSPLPRGLDNHWGASREFTDAGYSILYPKEGMLKTTDGVAMVQIKLPTKGVYPNMFHLLHADGKGKNTRQDANVIAERNGAVATYYIQCPLIGEYRLEIYAKYNKEDTGFYVGAAFLLQCSSPVKTVLELENNSSLLGTNEHFHNMGLVTSAKGATLNVKRGEARLRVKKTKPAKLLGKLEGFGVAVDNVDSFLSTKEDGDLVTFTVTPTEKGLYALKIFAAEPKVTSLAFAGCFAILHETDLGF